MPAGEPRRGARGRRSARGAREPLAILVIGAALSDGMDGATSFHIGEYSIPGLSDTVTINRKIGETDITRVAHPRAPARAEGEVSADGARGEMRAVR
jgi:hypothetical protein